MDSTPAQQLSLKVSFKDDFRRVSVPRAIDYLSLLATVKKLFSTLTEEELQSLIIRYQDDESDWITITSDAELEEAISLVPYDSPVLRLTLLPKKAKQCPSGNARACHWGHAFQQLQQQQHCGWKRWCGARANFFYLHKAAIASMENGTKSGIENARDLFHEQLSIGEHPTPLYNIACCEALLGNSENALNFLRKSVSAGYRDVNHIENDDDLKSLRHLDGYIAIVEALKQDNNDNDDEYSHVANRNSSNSSSSNSSNSSRSNSSSNSSSVPASQPKSIRIPIVFSDSTPEPVAPAYPVNQVPVATLPVVPPVVPVVAPSAPEPEPVSSPFEAALTALVNMGFSDRKSNEQALARARLNIPLAVQFLLERQQYY